MESEQSESEQLNGHHPAVRLPERLVSMRQYARIVAVL